MTEHEQDRKLREAAEHCQKLIARAHADDPHPLAVPRRLPRPPVGQWTRRATRWLVETPPPPTGGRHRLQEGGGRHGA